MAKNECATEIRSLLNIAENSIHECEENSIELNDMLLVEMFFVL